MSSPLSRLVGQSHQCCFPARIRCSNELPTGRRPTLEDENGKALADFGLLPKSTRLAIVPWLLVFFIDAANSSRLSAVRLPLGRSPRARSRRYGGSIRASDGPATMTSAVMEVRHNRHAIVIGGGSFGRFVGAVVGLRVCGRGDCRGLPNA